MSKRTSELLFQVGLVLGAVVLGRVLDFPLGYAAATIFAIAFIYQWFVRREEGESVAELGGLFRGTAIPWADVEKTTSREESTGGRTLPEHRPRVIPAEYRVNKQRLTHGLTILNPGYMALDVHIPNVPLDPSGYTLVFPERLTQLGERDHKQFMEAQLAHATLPGLDGGQLFSVMRKHGIESFKFAIHYKDLDSVAYLSKCTMERDVELPGIRVAFSGQELAESSESWTDAGNGGPQIHLRWECPPEAVKYPGLGISQKCLQVENASPTEDAFNLEVEDLALDIDRVISASFKPIPRLMRNSVDTVKVTLHGQVPREHEGEFEMVYYSADEIPARFLQRTTSGELAEIKFPMVIRFHARLESRNAISGIQPEIENPSKAEG
jgi:hypothetical protein